ELLRSAITFIDTQAFEIMTPRINMFAYDIDDDINKLINDDKIFMYSRLPVYQESLDNIIGILPTKLLVKLMLENKPINVKELLLPVIYVPRFLNISNILKEFKLTHNHLAIVIDEYGGTEGLLTLEDIVEELVGEIFDEMDEIKEDIIQLDQTTFLVDGRVNIEDFFDLVLLEVDEEADYTTISGWCIDILEKFAKVGDAFTYKNLHVEIIEADEFRVEKVKVKVLEKEDKENN
ncbi:MAG: HlyC/CorC family transporter, partial [Erysipelotrichia bacterium]|nr:HlyC/CorC family transporter [Erysipelotrichia bacterium]